jgi:hypothetical protein
MKSGSEPSSKERTARPNERSSDRQRESIVVFRESLDKQAHGNVKELREFAGVILADGTLPVNHVRDHATGSKNGKQISLAKISRFHKIAQSLEGRGMPQRVADLFKTLDQHGE